jgi:hypothetical protein
MLLLFIFILFIHKQEWLECLSKIRCNKNEKKFCVLFLNVSWPFQANWGLRGHQAVISQYIKVLGHFVGMNSFQILWHNGSL